MVKIASEVAAKDGWEIKNVAVTDNVAYNDMVQNGEADANFAQHKPFMEQYTEEKNADLVAVQPMYDVKSVFIQKITKPLMQFTDVCKHINFQCRNHVFKSTKPPATLVVGGSETLFRAE